MSSRKWYRIENSTEPDTATIRIYDAVGGWFGVFAADFVRDLDAITASKIDLHVNSPGGDAFEGLAIMNSLRKHPAKVTAHVDGMAASIASVIVAGGADEVVMGLGAEIMIHNPAAMAAGADAGALRDIADRLDQMRDNLASIYMRKAGGDLADWQAAMDAETWYTAQEAVDAGLADRVAEDVRVPEAVKNAFDLSIYNYAGRAHAPAPTMPSAHAEAGSPAAPQAPAPTGDGSTEKPEGSPAVSFSDEQLTSMRQQLGIATDADEATILAALGEALAERAETPADPSATPAAPAAPAPVVASAATPPAGAVVIDSETLELIQAQARRGEEAFQRMAADERDRVISAAVTDGKIARSRVEHWRKAWTADPEGSKQALASMPKNLVPMEPVGHNGDVDGFSEEYAGIFPPSKEV